jgi:hypothetical protein
MSNDTVIDLYGTMGASSKRESNAYNGALGVGSKSPFAYTAGSAFTVTSFYNGMKTIYSVFADNGIPSIAELGSMPTTESSGIEVNVPVQVQDIAKFTESAVKLYRYFSVKPDVNLELDLGVGNIVYEGDNWRIYDKPLPAVVVMANVAYPLDNNQIPNLNVIRTQGLVIYAETGTVQFAASRESLSYTPSTLETLKRFDNIIANTLLVQVKSMTIRYNDNLVALSEALQVLPSTIRNIVRNQPFHQYLRIGSNFEIKNEKFKFMIPNTWNYRTSSYGSLSGSQLKGKTIILADSNPSASALAQHYKPNAIVIAYDRLLTDFGGKAEALKQMKEFADMLGAPYVIASEESVKVFGATANARANKGVVATNLMYRASGFLWKPNSGRHSCYVTHNNHTVNSANKPYTIGIPMFSNIFTKLDFSTELHASFKDIYEILVHLNYQKPLTFVAIPKTHKEHMANTIDIFTFLKSLGDISLNCVTDSLVKELSSKNWHPDVKNKVKLPDDIVAYITEASNILQSTNERQANQVASAFNRLEHPIKIVEKQLSATARVAHEKYRPLDICRVDMNDDEKLKHFSKLAHSIDGYTKIKGK